MGEGNTLRGREIWREGKREREKERERKSERIATARAYAYPFKSTRLSYLLREGKWMFFLSEIQEARKFKENIRRYSGAPRHKYTLPCTHNSAVPSK